MDKFCKRIQSVKIHTSETWSMDDISTCKLYVLKLKTPHKTRVGLSVQCLTYSLEIKHTVWSGVL